MTKGEPEVVEVAVADRGMANLDRLLQLAASAEQASEHPLAPAIIAAAKAKSLSLGEVQHFEAVPVGEMQHIQRCPADDEHIHAG